MTKPNACQICGRTLSAPESLAAGVGPVCGGRSYTSRVFNRFGGKHGWKGMDAFESANSPCYTCKHFKIPPKDAEVDTYDGRIVSMEELSKRFDGDAIGGFCKAKELLVDGNQIRGWTQCQGKLHDAREGKPKTVKGVLSTPTGDIVFEV